MSTKTIMNAKQTTGAGTGYPLNNIYTKENVVMIVCDGSDYIIYEQGDELPIQPNEGE